MKIKLTDQQIQSLIGAKEEALKATYLKEVEKLKVTLEKDVEALKKKYEHFEISLDSTEPKKRTPINEEEVKTLVKDGLTKSEIAKKLGKTYASIDQKLKKMKLEVKKKGK